MLTSHQLKVRSTVNRFIEPCSVLLYPLKECETKKKIACKVSHGYFQVGIKKALFYDRTMGRVDYLSDGTYIKTKKRHAEIM